MSKKNKIYMPMGIGGLIKYGEEEESKIKLKPEHLVYIAIALAVFEIILKIIFG